MRSSTHALLGAIVAGATLSYAVAIPAVRDEDPADSDPVQFDDLRLQYQQRVDQFQQPVGTSGPDLRLQHRIDQFQQPVGTSGSDLRLQHRIDEAVWNLRSRIDPSTIEPYDFQWVGFLITEWGNRSGATFPGGCELRRRLQAEVDDLTERAARSFLVMEDIAAFQERVIDARLDMAIHRLQTVTEASRNPEEEPVTTVEESYAEVVRLLYERAEAAQDDPNAQSVRDRLVQRLDETYKHVYQTVGFLQQMRVELIEARFLRAKALLDEHASRMGISRRDYDRVIELWLDRARAMANEPFPTCQ